MIKLKNKFYLELDTTIYLLPSSSTTQCDSTK
jgi:hypothetical protein